jgi:predicted transcriptional regulator
MRQITLRLPDDVVDRLDEEADERGVSRSEHIRDLLDDARRVDDLEAEVEQERARADDLRRQLAEANRRDEDVAELVRARERERELEERRAEANLATRLKWWLTGMDD